MDIVLQPYDRNQTPGSFNSTSNRTMLGHENPTVRFWRDVANIWITLPLSLFGIVGNTVSFVVLCYMRRNKVRSVITMLQTLVVSDSLVLITAILLRSLRSILGDDNYVTYVSIIYTTVLPISFVFRMVNVWLTVVLTAERYIAVCHPLHATTKCTVKKTYLHILAVILFALTFNIPRFFEGTYVYTPNEKEPSYQTNEIAKNKYYNGLYRIMLFSLFQYIIPMLLLVWFNGKVVLALRRPNFCPKVASVRKNEVKPANENGAKTTPAAHAHKSNHFTSPVTKIVVVVVLMCIVCHVIGTIAHVIYSLQVAFFPFDEGYGRLDLFRRHASNLANLLFTINSAVNFIIYCACSRNFRSVLVRFFWWLVCCRAVLPPKRRQLRAIGVGHMAADERTRKVSSTGSRGSRSSQSQMTTQATIPLVNLHPTNIISIRCLPTGVRTDSKQKSYIYSRNDRIFVAIQ